MFDRVLKTTLRRYEYSFYSCEWIQIFRSSRPEVFSKEACFKKFTGKHQCQSLFLINMQAETYSFIKKETLVQVFS